MVTAVSRGHDGHHVRIVYLAGEKSVAFRNIFTRRVECRVTVAYLVFE